MNLFRIMKEKGIDVSTSARKRDNRTWRWNQCLSNTRPDNVHIEWQQEVAQLPQKLPPLRGGLVS